jgi:hypothetical protein
MTPGPVELMAGRSALDLPLSAPLTITGAPIALERRTTFLTGAKVARATRSSR